MSQQQLSIDLTDPGVLHMLGGAGAATGKRREVVQLAGDDPSSAMHGISVTDLSTGKQEVLVVYREMFLTVDVYAVPGEPLQVVMHCPRCRKLLMVRADRKAIDFDPAHPNPVRTEIVASGRAELVNLAAIGRLSIEAFECPWEIGDAPHVAGAVHTGASLCRQRLVIDDNRARDV